MRIYMISLRRDVARRKKIQELFPRYYSSFHIIDALDAQDKDSMEVVKYYGTPCAHESRKPLTLGERCCALSHVIAIEEFLQTEDDHAIIIEDDLIGGDEDIDKAIVITKTIKNNSLLVLGGQQGLKNSKHLSGVKLSENFWKIPKVSSPFITRACCYALTPMSAEVILNSQKNSLDRSDSWHEYSNNIDIFYSNIFSHPADLSDSNLEVARRAGTFVQKVAEDGVQSLIKRASLKLLLNVAVFFRIYSRAEIK